LEMFEDKVSAALTLCRPAMAFGNRKISFRGYLQFIIVTVKKYHLSENFKFNNLGIY